MKKIVSVRTIDPRILAHTFMILLSDTKSHETNKKHPTQLFTYIKTHINPELITKVKPDPQKYPLAEFFKGIEQPLNIEKLKTALKLSFETVKSTLNWKELITAQLYLFPEKKDGIISTLINSVLDNMLVRPIHDLTNFLDTQNILSSDSGFSEQTKEKYRALIETLKKETVVAQQIRLGTHLESENESSPHIMKVANSAEKLWKKIESTKFLTDAEIIETKKIIVDIKKTLESNPPQQVINSLNLILKNLKEKLKTHEDTVSKRLLGTHTTHASTNTAIALSLPSRESDRIIDADLMLDAITEIILKARSEAITPNTLARNQEKSFDSIGAIANNITNRITLELLESIRSNNYTKAKNFFLTLLQKSIQKKNFQAGMSIYLALTSTAFTRLLDEAQKQDLEKVLKHAHIVFDPSNNFEKLRELQESKGAIPVHSLDAKDLIIRRTSEDELGELPTQSVTLAIQTLNRQKRIEATLHRRSKLDESSPFQQLKDQFEKSHIDDKALWALSYSIKEKKQSTGTKPAIPPLVTTQEPTTHPILKTPGRLSVTKHVGFSSNRTSAHYQPGAAQPFFESHLTPVK